MGLAVLDCLFHWLQRILRFGCEAVIKSTWARVTTVRNKWLWRIIAGQPIDESVCIAEISIRLSRGSWNLNAVLVEVVNEVRRAYAGHARRKGQKIVCTCDQDSSESPRHVCTNRHQGSGC